MQRERDINGTGETSLSYGKLGIRDLEFITISPMFRGLASQDSRQHGCAFTDNKMPNGHPRIATHKACLWRRPPTVGTTSLSSDPRSPSIALSTDTSAPMLTMPQLTHAIAFLLLLSRIGDIGSTYLITPTLKLEANPIVRRLKWRFAIATLLMAVVPYFSLPAGVTLLITSLLVCASNCSRIWIARTLGETEYHLFLIRVARRAPVGLSIVFFLLSPLCMALIGGVIWLFYPDLHESWGAWIAIGFVMYAVTIALYGSLAFLRLRKEGLALTTTDVSALPANS